MAELLMNSAILSLPKGIPIMTGFVDQTMWIGGNLDIRSGLNSTSVDLIYFTHLSTPSEAKPQWWESQQLEPRSKTHGHCPTWKWSG